MTLEQWQPRFITYSHDGVKAMVFPVVMYGCESWTIKKAERQKIDAFVLWCWRRLLRVPWTARRSNQSILKEISPGCSLEGLMLKLKLQYFTTSCEERRRQRHPTPVLLPGKSHGWRRLEGCSPWGHKESDTTEHWKELNWLNLRLTQLVKEHSDNLLILQSTDLDLNYICKIPSQQYCD